MTDPHQPAKIEDGTNLAYAMDMPADGMEAIGMEDVNANTVPTLTIIEGGLSPPDGTGKNEHTANSGARKKRRYIKGGEANGNTTRALYNRGIGLGIEAVEARVGKITKIAKKSGGGTGGILNKWGMTVKQEAFARLAGYEGKTLASSYRDAGYSCRGKPNTIYRAAQDLADTPHVAARINYWVERRSMQQSHTPDKIRAFIIEKLHELAEGASKEADKLKAIELLGKLDIVGIFKDRTVTETNLSEDPMVIRDRIKALLAAA